MTNARTIDLVVRAATLRARNAVVIASLSWNALSDWKAPRDFALQFIAMPAVNLIGIGVLAGHVMTPRDQRHVVVGLVGLGLTWTVLTSIVKSHLNDRRLGTLVIVMASPVSRPFLLLMRAVGPVAAGLGTVVSLSFIAAVSFDLRQDVDWVTYAAAAIVTSVSVGGFGVLLLAVSYPTREFWVVSAGAGGLVTTLSGAIVPLASFPEPLRAFSVVVPMRWSIEAMRAAAGAGQIESIARNLGLELAVGLAWLLVAVASFSLLEQRARRTGNLDAF